MIFGHVTRAVSASALALSLTGCVGFPATAQYGCGYAVHGRRLYAVQCPYNYGLYAPAPYYAPAPAQAYVGGASPYYAQPAPEPAPVNPTPLRSINPTVSESDNSCVGWWRLCHLY